MGVGITSAGARVTVLETGTTGSAPGNVALRSCRHRGRAIWRCRTGTQRRSLVETWMRCCKGLGERVMAHDVDAQVAELQIRAFAGSLEPVAFTGSLLNRCTALGTPRTAQARLGKG